MRCLTFSWQSASTTSSVRLEESAETGLAGYAMIADAWYVSVGTKGYSRFLIAGNDLMKSGLAHWSFGSRSTPTTLDQPPNNKINP